MRKSLLLVLMLVLFLGQLFSQNRAITGKVTDANGEPIANASVIVKGSSRGTTTNSNGEFSLSITGTVRTIVISGVGFAEQELSVTANQRVYSAILQTSGGKALEEVIVSTGYTKAPRSKFTGAASSISPKNIENVPMASFDQILQGQSPGLLVNSGSGQPGASASVTIRGVQSIAAAGAQPLYIIDGIPVESGQFQSINPNDFESVTILKDASAAALYGSRAATGVIVITTKKGRAGRTNFTVRTQFGFNSFLPFTNFDLMNSTEKLLHEENNKYGPGWTYSRKNPNNATSSAAILSGYDHILDSMRLINLDYKKILFRQGVSQTHEFNVSGGTEKTRFFMSGNYFHQDGTDLNSYLNRYTARFNIEHSDKGFTFSMTNSVGFTQNAFSEGDFVGNSARNPFQISWRAMPYENPYLPNGTLDSGTTTAAHPRYISNTLEAIANTTGRQNQLKMNSGINLSYLIAKHLMVKTTLGVDMRDDRWLRYINPNSLVGRSQTYNKGLNSEANYVNTQIISTTGATYSNVFAKKHEVEASSWFEVIRNWQRGLGFTVYGLDPRLPETGQGAGTATNGFPPVATSAKSGSGIRSFFGLLRYTYDSRYTLNASVRRDGTSRIINPANKEIISWSIGGAWNAMREEFMENQNIFSDLKVRASYGITPNINSISTTNYTILTTPLLQVTNYQGPQSASFGTTTYAGSILTGIIPSSPGNPDLRIENVRKTNIGFDAAFLHNRVQLVVDVYKNTTVDLFVNQPLPRETGFTSRNVNAGILSNKGIEAMVTVDVIKNRDVTWTVSANHAINKNMIVDLGLVDQYETGTFLIKKGLSYGTHYTYNYLGADPATGLPVYETQAGGRTTDLSKAGRFTKFGSYLPVHVGGINNSIRVKNITLSALVSYQFDVNRSNNTLSWVARGSTGYSGVVNQLKYMNTAQWLKPGDVAAYQSSLYDRDFTSTDIQNAAFMRLRNVTLSYQLPTTVAARLRYIRSARFYVQGQNLLIWSPWEGPDPEDNNNISLNEYASSRMLVAGMEINF